VILITFGGSIRVVVLNLVCYVGVFYVYFRRMHIMKPHAEHENFQMLLLSHTHTHVHVTHVPNQENFRMFKLLNNKTGERERERERHTHTERMGYIYINICFRQVAVLASYLHQCRHTMEEEGDVRHVEASTTKIFLLPGDEPDQDIIDQSDGSNSLERSHQSDTGARSPRSGSKVSLSSYHGYRTQRENSRTSTRSLSSVEGVNDDASETETDKSVDECDTGAVADVSTLRVDVPVDGPHVSSSTTHGLPVSNSTPHGLPVSSSTPHGPPVSSSTPLRTDFEFGSVEYKAGSGVSKLDRSVSNHSSEPDVSIDGSVLESINPEDVTVPVIGYEVMEQRARFSVSTVHLECRA
jgi:hypothetical protein